MNASIVCTNCGAEIGHYTDHGSICIKVGPLMLRDAWGWCECGEPWTFHSSDKQLESLINKIMKLRVVISVEGET